jgi:hypothetical protein
MAFSPVNSGAGLAGSGNTVIMSGQRSNCYLRAIGEDNLNGFD